MVTYKEKIVCFIDILGFKNIVMHKYVDDPDKLYSILSKISIAVEDWSKTAIAQEKDLQITQFSDSIVFSFTPGKHYSMNFHFFKELAIMMINEEIIFRGGITYGKIIHDRQLVFGPAMIEAYLLESEKALYPRIIIDEKAMAVRDSDDKTIRDYPGQFIVNVGDNDFATIDYIYDTFPSALNQAVYYKKLHELISKGLECPDEKTKKKYIWMKSEYNRAKEKFSELIPL